MSGVGFTAHGVGALDPERRRIYNDSRAYKCDSCGDYFANDELQYDDDDNRYCPGCYEIQMGGEE